MIIQKKTWPRPQLPPPPLEMAGLAHPVIDLGGIWKFTWEAPEQFWLNSARADEWLDMPVPGDVSAQRTEPATAEYAYRQKVFVPADYAGKRILLRFDGANYEARVWVDGHPAGRHCGGFTTWDCDITELVTAGQYFQLTVGIQDQPNHLNPENKGGLIRPVRLIALPPTHIGRLHLTTTADQDYENFTLQALFNMRGLRIEQAGIAFALVSPAGERMELAGFRPAAGTGEADCHLSWPIRAPQLWDAEHPRLYTLEAMLSVDGSPVEKVVRRFGFRHLEISGSRMLVNGREIKLRGICRQDISPLGGRAVTPELIDQDLRLLKKANINYIRTTSYPPGEYFLDCCDRYGFYVQEEAPVAYVDSRVPAAQNDPQYADEIMSQFAEMIERDQSHPAVIIWGLGSESAWGSNFRLEKEHARRADPTRPLVFNYPMSCQGEADPPEIWSVHYLAHNLDAARQYDHMIIGHTHGSDLPPGYALGLSSGHDRPVLHDEYAHVACYDRDALKRDPGVRDFWGESIRVLWDKIWQTPGALGGAVWSAIDDVTLHAGGSSLYEWGILDVWRRPKPEYHHVRKAYAPVRVLEQTIAGPAAGQAAKPSSDCLAVTVENRYCHTDLAELTIIWSAETSGKAAQGTIRDFRLQPGSRGELQIPAEGLNRTGAGSLNLQFIDASGESVAECVVGINPPARRLTEPAGPAPAILEQDDTVTVRGKDFTITFSRTSGLIIAGSWQGSLLLRSGPYLHLEGIRLPAWRLDQLSAAASGHEAIVSIRGHYGDIAAVTFKIGIDGQGLITTGYQLDQLNAAMPRTVKIRVGLDCGGLDEIGISYLLDPGIDKLAWQRRGLWTTYPPDHIGRVCGVADRRCQPGSPETAVGAMPDQPWSADTRSYALYGAYDLGRRGTNDFRSMKREIYWAAATKGTGQGAVVVESDGSAAVRLAVVPDSRTVIDDRDPAIRYVGTWYAMDDPSGSRNNTEMFSETAGDSAEVDFQGTGIQWFGPADMIGGIARVTVDGQLKDSQISQYAEEVEKPGMSRGYEKRYQKLLFSIDNLPMGKHTLRIEVTGQKNKLADYAYVMIDWFRVLGPGDDPVRLIINNDYNYTRLAWGNFVRPAIRVASGYQNSVRLRLSAGPDSCERRNG